MPDKGGNGIGLQPGSLMPGQGGKYQNGALLQLLGRTMPGIPGTPVLPVPPGSNNPAARNPGQLYYRPPGQQAPPLPGDNPAARPPLTPPLPTVPPPTYPNPNPADTRPPFTDLNQPPNGYDSPMQAGQYAWAKNPNGYVALLSPGVQQFMQRMISRGVAVDQKDVLGSIERITGVKYDPAIYGAFTPASPGQRG